jgi:8-oxo-dGTP pyrophosphatase MutT (NUDIX family)
MTKSELIHRLQQTLPGVRAHEAFAPYRKHFENHAEAIRKKAAVGIHVYLYHEEWHFLLIERSSYDGKHSAQMAFPGGKPESTDLHLEHTARRESEEEMAIPSLKGDKITELSMVWIPVSSFEVSPFVFLHDERPIIEINKREVAQYYEVKIKDLIDERSVTTTAIQVNENVHLKDVPCFVLNEKIVWGATALILAELKMLLKMN